MRQSAQNVELVYDRDCPNVSVARERLSRALKASGRPLRWTERDRAAPETPKHARGHGSPAILVNERDVAGRDASPAEATCCRVYPSQERGCDGTPPVRTIVAALSEDGASRSEPKEAAAGDRPSWRSSLAALPGLGASMLPGVCPACWPAWAGLLGSLGLGFSLETTYLPAVLPALLAIALASLAYRASNRRGLRPFALGAVGVALILSGKFVFLAGSITYAGAGFLAVASLWNAWPQRPKATRYDACPCRAHGNEPDSIESTVNEKEQP